MWVQEVSGGVLRDHMMGARATDSGTSVRES
jgi:hypothetical protein